MHNGRELGMEDHDVRNGRQISVQRHEMKCSFSHQVLSCDLRKAQPTLSNLAASTTSQLQFDPRKHVD